MAGPLSLYLTLRDVEGNFGSDIGTRVAVEQLESRRVWEVPNPPDFSRGPVTIRLETATGGWYRCRVTPTRYRPQEQEFLAPDDDDQVRIELTLRRRADAWQVKFVPWASLAPRFDSLRSLLGESPRILLVETSGEITGFVEDKYDGVNSGPEGLAKATLLNLYHELLVTYEPVEGIKPLLSFVRSIEALGRDRILVLADSQLTDVLTAIAQNEKAYPEWRVLGVELQRFYLPTAYRARITTTYHLRLNSVGNTLDVTLDTLRGADFVLVTFAMVERTGQTAHSVLGAPFGGDAILAHPVDVHEWLIEAAKLVGPVPDLGYQLVPL